MGKEAQQVCTTRQGELGEQSSGPGFEILEFGNSVTLKRSLDT